MAKYKHNTGSLPFFRLSKLCASQWLASIAMIIYGFSASHPYAKLIPIAGFLTLLFAFFVNELVLNSWAKLC